jgi:hypothetical protein
VSRFVAGFRLRVAEQLFAVDLDTWGGDEAQADLPALDLQDADADVVRDDDFFPDLAAEYEHGETSM